ncbi:MAG: helix-turn-helix domain-containing protein [Alistipes sp.]|nr:helix-turn-helix domain-containing protein [Alistipes sp.]
MDKKRNSKTVVDSVCHVHKSVGYTALSNCFVRSTNIHCPAIGLLGKVMSLPPTWNFTKAGLVAICGDGETTVETALAELEEFGYVKKTLQMPDESPTGRIRCVYDFYEYSEKDDSLPKYDVVMETFTVDNATLNRVRKDSNFTLISNKLLQNKEMKLKLLGFLLKVLSLPDSWHFSMKGLEAICKEGRTAVRSAVGRLMDMGYLVRTKLLPNESVNHTYEYVYEFFEKPLSKEESENRKAETRRKAITMCRGGADSKAEKQQAENLPLDSLPSEIQHTENQGQYNTKNKISKNSLPIDQSSILPSATKKKNFDRETDGFQKDIEVYTDIVKRQIDYCDHGEWLCRDDNDGFAEADEIVGIIVAEICSTAPYGQIKGQKFPRAVIKSVLLKADIVTVENALTQIAHVDNVRNFKRYFISTLYDEVTQRHFKENCENRWANYAVNRDFGYAYA